jgi:hypothetical protein
MTKASDPYYNRKPVPSKFYHYLYAPLPALLTPCGAAELIKDVGYTGLSSEEEFWNREKKYTAAGADVRRFSKSLTGGLEPLGDPYYGRKSISSL